MRPGEIDLPKRKYQRRAPKNSSQEAAQTVPTATMAKETQTELGETASTEFTEMDSADQMTRELPAMMPPEIWEKEPRLRWISPSGTESISISGNSSDVSEKSDHAESPEALR